jgi:prepilin-type processing-associated H-X9-DG protein
VGDQSSPFITPREVDDSGFERGPDDRHSGICNVAFMDGHVKAMKPQAFFNGWNGIWFRYDRMAVKSGDPNLPR